MGKLETDQRASLQLVKNKIEKIAASLTLSPSPTGREGEGGWEYLWVRSQDSEDADVLVKQPVAAPHVESGERVYEYGNFALLGIGG